MSREIVRVNSPTPFEAYVNFVVEPGYRFILYLNRDCYVNDSVGMIRWDELCLVKCRRVLNNFWGVHYYLFINDRSI